MKRTAHISSCGNYRYRLGRRWDERPVLLVCMFNPSFADRRVDDATITHLCQIASHCGFGALTVVNAIPFRTPSPIEAAKMTRWSSFEDFDDRDRLQQNLGIIATEVARAGAVLLAWGALADHCSEWIDTVRERIQTALPKGVPLYCLGTTASGYPKHPLARGKHRVPKNAQLLRYQAATVIASQGGVTP